MTNLNTGQSEETEIKKFVTVLGNVGWTYSKNIETGQAYQFRVVAVNEIGFSEPSDLSQTVLIACVPDKPGTPTLVSSSPSSVSFKWAAPESSGG